MSELAVKVTTCDDKLILEQCINEYKILRSLSHINIVKVNELFFSNNKCYLVMEKAEGIPLKNLIKQRQLDHHEILQIIKQALEALNYLHQNGISHRDLKPDNLIVNPADLSVKLIDFNVSTKFDKIDECENYPQTI